MLKIPAVSSGSPSDPQARLQFQAVDIAGHLQLLLPCKNMHSYLEECLYRSSFPVRSRWKRLHLRPFTDIYPRLPAPNPYRSPEHQNKNTRTPIQSKQSLAGWEHFWKRAAQGHLQIRFSVRLLTSKLTMATQKPRYQVRTWTSHGWIQSGWLNEYSKETRFEVHSGRELYAYKTRRWWKRGRRNDLVKLLSLGMWWTVNASKGKSLCSLSARTRNPRSTYKHLAVSPNANDTMELSQVILKILFLLRPHHYDRRWSWYRSSGRYWLQICRTVQVHCAPWCLLR